MTRIRRFNEIKEFDPIKRAKHDLFYEKERQVENHALDILSKLQHIIEDFTVDSISRYDINGKVIRMPFGSDEGYLGTFFSTENTNMKTMDINEFDVFVEQINEIKEIISIYRDEYNFTDFEFDNTWFTFYMISKQSLGHE